MPILGEASVSTAVTYVCTFDKCNNQELLVIIDPTGPWPTCPRCGQQLFIYTVDTIPEETVGLHQ